ncbi:hypothetical protein ENSA5_31390 [Enhygromyxa salina]|uniref:Uncharacterized protein n=1 Tax=Enhygromyxa salina TaxID=215803 RepID=A0A2S9XYH9_9BACT|nr:hypothetical protein [Enhygromyxa salina]PRP97906.1 hypothetical protein ENSA5_31390 [Enhygromyxa salina]
MSSLTLPSDLDPKVIPGGSDGDILLDNRYFPISIAKLRGSDPEESVVHGYYRWREKASAFAHRAGVKHVTIMEFHEWGVPKPTIRKLISEYSSKDLTEVGFQWQFLIVTKPVMRGAITAIVWLRGDTGKYSWASDYPDAVEKAVAEFVRIGIEPPKIDPLSYEFPVAELAKFGSRR